MNAGLSAVIEFMESHDLDEHETRARELFGDAWVDRYYWDVLGLNVHAARCDCLAPATCELRNRSDETRGIDGAFLVAG